MKLPSLPALTRLNEREKKILMVTIVLVLVLLGYHGVLTPVTEKFSSLDREIFMAEMKLRKAKTLVRQREDVVVESQKYPNLERMDAGTDEEETARLLNLIEQTARTTGVSLSDVKPQAIVSDKLTKRFAVELNAESGIEALIQFVYALENAPEALKIELVNTAPKEENSAVLRSQITAVRVVLK
jgi:Tfp pilus assembly protein PilO